MVAREKIRAYVNQHPGQNAERANVISRVISKAYSGFVHGASPNIMDMYGGSPPRFDVAGEHRKDWRELHANDALNYLLRALFSIAFAALAFDEQELFLELRAKADELEASMIIEKAGIGFRGNSHA